MIWKRAIEIRDRLEATEDAYARELKDDLGVNKVTVDIKFKSGGYAMVEDYDLADYIVKYYTGTR